MSRRTDRRLSRRFEQALLTLVEHGVPKDEAIASLQDPLIEAADASASRVVEELLATQENLLDGERALHREFNERLTEDWGKAFDAFYVAAYCVAEAGDRFLDTHQARATRRGDTVFQVLSELHARARRISFEIHHLLTGGFPLGALARARTMHELAIVATVIGEDGRAEGTKDLAQRYLDHDAIGQSKYLSDLSRYAAAIGAPPPDAEMVAEVQAQRRAMIQKYEPGFAKDYGWAAPATTTGHAPKFDELHEIANMSHLRSQYRVMCGEVHAGPMGLNLNLVEWGDGLITLPGPTNIGLRDPGVVALASLGQVTWAFIFCGSPDDDLISVTDLLAFRTLLKLIDRFGPLAEAAEAQVMEREAKLDRNAG